MPSSKRFLLLGGVNAVLVVLLGAFGAHALNARLPAEMMAVYQTGVHYHMFHALGLLTVGAMAAHRPTSVYLKWSGWLMLIGIVLFCGSLYVLSVSGLRWLGIVTPFGGITFIAAWALFVLAVLKAP